MFTRSCFLASCLFVCCGASFLAGCGTGAKNEEQIVVDVANDPLYQPRQILKRYAEGQPFGSESSMFSNLVDTVRKTDPERADILEKGLKELQAAAPAKRPELAKKLLSELQPKM